MLPPTTAPTYRRTHHHLRATTIADEYCSLLAANASQPNTVDANKLALLHAYLVGKLSSIEITLSAGDVLITGCAEKLGDGTLTLELDATELGALGEEKAIKGSGTPLCLCPHDRRPCYMHRFPHAKIHYTTLTPFPIFSSCLCLLCTTGHRRSLQQSRKTYVILFRVRRLNEQEARIFYYSFLWPVPGNATELGSIEDDLLYLYTNQTGFDTPFDFVLVELVRWMFDNLL